MSLRARIPRGRPSAEPRAGSITVLLRRAVPAAVALLLGLAPAAAQETGRKTTDGRVLAARFDARVPSGDSGDGATRVEIGFRVVADRPVERIPVKALAAFGTVPEDLRASVGGAAASSRLSVDRPPVLSGSVLLPRPAEPGDTLELSLSYRLPAAIPGTAGDFDVVLPVLYVDWKPAGAPEDLLVATVEMPSEYSVLETFPTVPKETSVRGGTRRYRFQLQAVPSLVRFRGEAGDPTFFTFSRLVDLGVLLALAVGAAFGWRALRRERARAEAAEAESRP